MRNQPLSCAIFLMATLLPTVSTLAQWVQRNAGTTEDLYSVDYFNPNTIWVGSYNQLLKTANGGANWSIAAPVKNEFGITIFPANLYDIAVTGPNSGIAAGFFLTGNEDYVLVTNNSGQSWKANSFLNFPFQAPFFSDALAFRNGRAVASFSSGFSPSVFLFMSDNAGASWYGAYNPFSQRIEDIYMASQDTIFVVSGNQIGRTTTGAQTIGSWTATPVPDMYLQTVCAQGNTVYAGGYGAVMAKSTDYGDTFQKILLPFGCTGVVWATDANTVIAAGTDGLYISRTGGVGWEKFALPNYTPIQMMDFLDSKRGIAVGGGGYIIQTDDLSKAPSLPLAFFEAKGDDLHFCLGDTLHLINRSAPGYTYQWLKNGTVFSTDFQPVLPLNETGTFTIALRVSNASGSDERSVEIHVEGHFEFVPFSIAYSPNDTVCSGQQTKLTFPYTLNGGWYYFRQNGKNVGFVESFGPGEVRVTTPPINGTTTFELVASRQNACFWDTLSIPVTIYDATHDLNAPFALSRDSACYYDTVSLLVPKSLPGYRYTWHSQTNGAEGTKWVEGTGGTISIPLPLLSKPEAFSPRAVSDQYGCSGVFAFSQKAYVERPYPFFTVSSYNPEAGEATEIVNRSENPGGTFFWDFGPGAVPQFSNSPAPSNVTFSSPGQNEVKLLATTPYGCLDSTMRTIRVLDKIVDERCSFSQGVSALNDDGPLSLTQDRQGNMIYWHSGGRNYHYWVSGNHGDSIANIWKDDLHFSYGHFLTKFNAKGVAQWTVQLRHESTWAKYGEVTADEAGNIYCAYFHGEYLDDVRIYSTDGRITTFDPPKSGIASVLPVIVMKFNKNGILQWVNAFMDSYALQRLAVKLDDMGNLYVCTDGGLQKFDASGTLQWFVTGIFSDVDIDNRGFVWVSDNGKASVKKFNPTDGHLLFESEAIPRFYVTNIKMDELDNLYLAGSFYDSMTFGNETLYEFFPGAPGHGNVVLGKMKPNGRQEWVKQLNSGSQVIVKGIEVKNNHVLLLATTFDTVRTPSLPPLPITGGGHYLYHTDTLGGAEAIMKLYDFPKLSINSGQGSMLCMAKTSERLALAFEFSDNFQFAGQTVKYRDEPDFGENNFFLANGGFDCFLPAIPTSTTPYSYFLPSALKTCASESIRFEDLSSNQPTTWKWEFPGGVPAISTEQSPLVRFDLPGAYLVRLTASNAAGQGTVFTRKIIITPVPTIAITGDSVTCVGTGFAEFFAAVSDPTATLQWQDSTSTHGWANLPNGNWVSINVWQPAMSLNGSRYRCVVTNYCRSYVSRTITLKVNPLPIVTFDRLPDVCRNAANFTLKSGTPAGGQYEGVGVLTGGVFSPAAAFAKSEITYTYTDAQGCVNQAVDTILVNDNCWKQPCDNRGLYFDNYDDQVNLNPIAGLPANANFTFEAWVRPFVLPAQECSANFNRLFSIKGSDADFEVGECQGKIALSWHDTQGAHGPFFTQNTPLYDDSWHHITVVRSGAVVRIYVDGIQKLVANGVGALNLSAFRLGFWASEDVPGYGWRGLVDQVRFWKEARTTAQILQGGRYCPPSGTEPNLLFYWKLDDGEAYANNTAVTRVTDASSNGNHGTLKNFALTGYESNFYCSEAPLLYADFNFPASLHCGEAVLFNDKFGGKYKGDLTYSWNFGDGTTSTEAQPLHQFDPCSDHKVCLTVSGATCSATNCFQTSTGLPPALVCPPSVTATAYDLFGCKTAVQNLHWREAKGNCDTPEMAFDVSGSDHFSGSGDASGTVFPEGVSTVHYTAKDLCGLTTTCSFEVTVECLPCTFDLNEGLKGYFPFEGNADDASATGINGTVVNATLTDGHDGTPNSAYHFDGATTRIEYSPDNRNITNAVTLCAWVRTGSQKGQWVAGKYNFDEDRGWHLGISDNMDQFPGRAVFAGRDGTGDYHLSGYSNRIINDEQWHCLVGVAANGLWQIYVDGNLENSALGSTVNLATSEFQYLTLGWHTHPSFPLWMDGDIDNVRLYNRILTPCEMDSVCTGGMVPAKEPTPLLTFPLHLYPNPNEGFLTLKLPEPAETGMLFRITDVAGHLLLEQAAQQGVAQQTVHADALPSGMYFLTVLEEGRVRGVVRFVKSDK